MATLTIRNLEPQLVENLKQLATERGHSMEQEVRELIEESVGERLSVLEQIEHGWKKQTRRPAARTVDAWIRTGRP